MITTATLDHLHLVDFPSLKPTDLQTKVTQAIDNANAFLDDLDKQADKQENNQASKQDRPALTASQALQDIIEFDHINLDLDRHWGIVSHLNSVMSNDDIRHVHHELLPKLSAYGTRVGQHQPLFARYQAVADDTEFFGQLDEARRRAIELALRNFALSGVALPKEQQAKYADIQSQLSTLSAKFSDNVLDATQAFALPLTQEQLAGIPESGQALLADAGERFKEKQANDNNGEKKKEYPTPYYVATLDMPVYLAIMTDADDRQLREQIYQAFTTRASEFDKHVNGKGESLNNADIMVQILALRQQKAKLLDLDNYAQLSLSTKMADTPEQVEQFLRDLASQANPTAIEDLQQLQEMGKQLGIDEIKAWDMAYLAEKVKQQKFSLSQEEVRPYFPLPTVIDGLFGIVQRLYGIRIEEHSKAVARWHEDVRFYQLFDENDSLIGGFYFDLYARQGKRGGAWMSGFQPRYAPVDSDYQQLPVCFMVANFTPPIKSTNATQSAQADKPSLLTHNEVLTLFHEFGHGLHHLLTQVSVGDVAGVNGVEWDAVELPSQFMENWAWDAEGIALISSHVETGEPLPEEKLQALLTAKNFQSGMQTLRQIEFALFDLLLHSQNPAPDYAGILQQLQQVRADIAIMDTPDYNRFANGFSHIFAGGYASGYYSYKWAELLSADAFSKFEEEGIFNPQTGKAFRETILAVGGSRPAKTNFEAFRGRPANIEALLRHSGFMAVANNQDSNNPNNSKAS